MNNDTKDTIQFIANYQDWVSIKKLKIEEKTDPKMIMEFLASLGTGIDVKVEHNLGKIVELKKLDNAVEEEVEKGKNEAAVSKAIAAVSSRKITQIINEIATNPDWQKNEQKEIQDFCKAYVMRKALKKLGLMIDYSEIEIPGMKRLKKKKS